MRRIVSVLVGAAATAAAAWIGPGAAPAGACSCAAPVEAPPLVVDATAVDTLPAEFGQLWTFEVDEVVEGEAAGQLEVVVATGDEAGCGIALEPAVGGSYRLALHPPGDGGPFHVNLCTGSIEELAAGGGGPPPVGDEGSGPPYAWYVLGTLGGLTVLALAGAAIAGRVRPSS